VAVDREGDLIATFVSLASTLARGYDVVDLLDTLTADCVRLLDVASAGLLLADGLGQLHVLAASSPDTRILELYQLQARQGPCIECFVTGAPVSVPDLHVEAARWPVFSDGALAAGFVSVHAVPMQLREQTLGTLGLFGTTVGSLNSSDLNLARAFADVSTAALVQQTAVDDRSAVVAQLQGALSSRIVIEQAKGILAQRGELDMNEAYAVLRRYARDNNLKFGDAARAVTTRAITAQQVLD
jgi:hypothetical protein